MVSSCYNFGISPMLSSLYPLPRSPGGLGGMIPPGTVQGRRSWPPEAFA